MNRRSGRVKFQFQVVATHIKLQHSLQHAPQFDLGNGSKSISWLKHKYHKTMPTIMSVNRSQPQSSFPMVRWAPNSSQSRRTILVWVSVIKKLVLAAQSSVPSLCSNQFRLSVKLNVLRSERFSAVVRIIENVATKRLLQFILKIIKNVKYVWCFKI